MIWLSVRSIICCDDAVFFVFLLFTMSSSASVCVRQSWNWRNCCYFISDLIISLRKIELDACRKKEKKEKKRRKNGVAPHWPGRAGAR